jgi:hypothetical protein
MIITIAVLAAMSARMERSALRAIAFRFVKRAKPSAMVHA